MVAPTRPIGYPTMRKVLWFDQLFIVLAIAEGAANEAVDASSPGSPRLSDFWPDNDNRSPRELAKIGINPSLKGSKATQEFPYVVFCAPTSRSLDYPGDISSAPFDCDDNGPCNEDFPVVPIGRRPRTDVLLKAEKVVLESDGCVLRLAGLYISFYEIYIQEVMDLVNKSGKFSQKFEGFTVGPRLPHQYAEALSDAQKDRPAQAARLGQGLKGYSRLGIAHFGLGSYNDAVYAYKKGHVLDPTNDGLKLSSSTSSLKLGFPGIRRSELLADASLHCCTVPILVHDSSPVIPRAYGTKSSVVCNSSGRMKLLDILESATVINNDRKQREEVEEIEVSFKGVYTLEVQVPKSVDSQTSDVFQISNKFFQLVVNNRCFNWEKKVPVKKRVMKKKSRKGGSNKFTHGDSSNVYLVRGENGIRDIGFPIEEMKKGLDWMGGLGGFTMDIGKFLRFRRCFKGRRDDQPVFLLGWEKILDSHIIQHGDVGLELKFDDPDEHIMAKRHILEFGLGVVRIEKDIKIEMRFCNLGCDVPSRDLVDLPQEQSNAGSKIEDLRNKLEESSNRIVALGIEINTLKDLRSRENKQFKDARFQTNENHKNSLKQMADKMKDIKIEMRKSYENVFPNPQALWIDGQVCWIQFGRNIFTASSTAATATHSSISSSGVPFPSVNNQDLLHLHGSDMLQSSHSSYHSQDNLLVQYDMLEERPTWPTSTLTHSSQFRSVKFQPKLLLCTSAEKQKSRRDRTMTFAARNYFRSFVVVCLAMANAFVMAQEEEEEEEEGGGGGDVKGTMFLVVIVLIAIVIFMPTQRQQRPVYAYRCP
ncbi:hypothetical protein C3L33_14883, partial [Rhododendron williamsianum]